MDLQTAAASRVAMETLEARLCLSAAASSPSHPLLKSPEPTAVHAPLSKAPPRHRIRAAKVTTSPAVVIATAPAPMGSAALAGRPMGGAAPFSASNSAAQMFRIGGGINSTGSFSADGALATAMSTLI